MRLGDGVWLTDGPDLAEGMAVAVKAVRGTWLFVEAIDPKSGADPAEAARA